MRVVVNGESRELDSPAPSVADLVAALGLGLGYVVVERNGDVVPRAEAAATPLTDGDRIELVRAVAGG